MTEQRVQPIVVAAMICLAISIGLITILMGGSYLLGLSLAIGLGAGFYAIQYF